MSNVIVFLWTSLIVLVAALILCVWQCGKHPALTDASFSLILSF